MLKVSSRQVTSSIFLSCILFLLVLGYRLIEWFSLTQSSFDDSEDDSCSLMNIQGQAIKHFIHL